MLARDDVIRMAREVGASSQLSNFNHAEGDLLERFAAAAYAAGQASEREACAKLVENQRYAVLQAFRTYTADELVQSLKSDAKTMAKLIRARGEKGGK